MIIEWTENASNKFYNIFISILEFIKGRFCFKHDSNTVYIQFDPFLVCWKYSVEVLMGYPRFYKQNACMRSLSLSLSVHAALTVIWHYRKREETSLPYLFHFFENVLKLNVLSFPCRSLYRILCFSTLKLTQSLSLKNWKSNLGVVALLYVKEYLKGNQKDRYVPYINNLAAGLFTPMTLFITFYRVIKYAVDLSHLDTCEENQQNIILEKCRMNWNF